MLSHLCKESEDDRAIIVIACWATLVMTPRPSGEVCVLATSFLFLRSATPKMAAGWVVERTFAWLNQLWRLRVPYEKRADIHEAFLCLECAICRRFLRVGLPAS